MNEELEHKSQSKNILSRFDRLVKKVIPNFNVRAIVYLSMFFAIAVYIQVWRIGNKVSKQPNTTVIEETIIADDSYWNSPAYAEKIRNQTVESFTNELEKWLIRRDQEFTRRKFEDILFINNSSTVEAGDDFSLRVPENFNYLENHGRARYQYGKSNNFLLDVPVLIKHGTVVCDIADKTEKATGIELYEWRYASMTKLAVFMKTKPDWKVQIGDRILDISDPRLEDEDVLAFRNAQSQPAGLFSFLVFREPESNRIVLADSSILENNGIDAKLTLARISSKLDKQPKIYFKFGFEGCKQITNYPEIHYEQFD